MFSPMLPRSDPAAPALLQDRADENLRFIRETMDRSATFSAVPGAGGVAMGVLGLAAAILSARETTLSGWLLVWLAIAPLAAGVGVLFLMRKARAPDTALAAPFPAANALLGAGFGLGHVGTGAVVARRHGG